MPLKPPGSCHTYPTRSNGRDGSKRAAKSLARDKKKKAEKQPKGGRALPVHVHSAAIAITSSESTYDSIGHQLLRNVDYEESLIPKLDLNSNRDQALQQSTTELNHLINATKRELASNGLLTKSDRTTDEKKRILTIIDKTLNQQFKFNEATAASLSQALISKTYRCNTGVLLFFAVNDALGLGLPLSMVEVRGHVFLRLGDRTDSSINWDINKRCFIPDQKYMEDFALKEEDLASSGFMKNLDANQVKSFYYTNLAVQFGRANLIDDAIAMNTQAIDIDPKNYMAFANRSSCYFAKGDDSSTERDANDAIRLNPMHFQAYANLGMILAGQGKFEEALVCYNKAIELDWTQLFVFINKVNVLMRLNRLQEASTALDLCERVSHNSLDYWTLRLQLFVKQGVTTGAAVEYAAKQYQRLQTK